MNIKRKRSHSCGVSKCLDTQLSQWEDDTLFEASEVFSS